jgi:4-hydroxyphenylacetate 3-monooxygenase
VLRSGARHLDSLRDGRAVFITGRRVDDVTTDPMFRNAVASIGSLYDFQSDPENRELMTYAVDGTGARANRIWQLPTSYAELVERRRALEAWAELHCGFVGRSPDHVASCISGMVMGLETFERYDPKRAAALGDYYRYARDNDLYLTYVIINPQADRSKGAGAQQTDFLTVGVVDRDARGITVRGAKMLGTAAVLANEIFVTSI